jgi:hypothetical protein
MKTGFRWEAPADDATLFPTYDPGSLPLDVLGTSSGDTSSGAARPAGSAAVGTTQAVQTAIVTTMSDEIAQGLPLTTAQSHLVINVAYDASVTGLQTSNPTLFSEFTNAVTAAVTEFENLIATAITVTINFGWGEVNGQTIDPGASGESSANLLNFSYGQLRTAVVNTDTTSAAQRTAAATLPATDPTNGGTFNVNVAEAKALGLSTTTDQDGWVGLDSSAATTWSWTRAGIQSGQEDAIGVLDHEISEVLGRSAESGKNGVYSLLDFFRYTATDGGQNDPIGTAVGVRDEPFVPGYTSAAFSYFSWNGLTVALPFETPADVATGSDVADWAPSVDNDAFGDGPSGQADTISVTDKRELSVLGYSVIACFAGGTRILTAAGPRSVETLAPGDEVHTALRGSGRIVWIGHRSFDCDRHPYPEQIWPVRIARDAFGPGLPERSLFLSPDHAVHVEGVLIPIKLLMNGTTIQQVPRRHVTYYHIELAAHDIVLAEGLPAESYLDTGNRTIFRDAGRPIALHPNFLAAQGDREARSCARLVTAPDELEPLWRALSRRATSLGWPAPATAPITLDPGLRLVAGERPIAPAGILGDRFSFVIPSEAVPMRLVSRTARPIDDMPWTGDQRRLGVKVRRLTHARGRDVREIAIDDPALGRGWWQVERDPGICRWTNGDALLPPLAGGVLTVALAGTMRYQTGTALAPNVPVAA